MQRSPSRPQRLASGAVAALTCVGLASCTASSSPPTHGPPASHRVLNPGEQRVHNPGPQDQIRFRDPVRPSGAGAPLHHPNLLMITIDDAALGDMRYMPGLRDLVAAKGVTLRNGLAPTPMCVPARASLLTGQYAHNHGALTMLGQGGGFAAFKDEDTLPVWLQDAGYDTLFTGKYLNGYGEDGTASYVPPGWTDWRAFVDPTTYNFVAPTVSDNGNPEEHHEYSSDVVSDITHEMLVDPARQDHPWYLWANYVAPHVGGPDAPDDPVNAFPDDPNPLHTTTPAPEDENTFSDLPLPDNPSMFEDTSDKWIIPTVHRKWPELRRSQLTEAHQQRIEALQSVDRGIVRTIRTLRRTGQLDETYVVVTSDNGFVLGEHNLDGKLWYFRDIVGVPMYIRGPGLPHGVTSAAPVTNADWAPTFAALAGAHPTRKVDGEDVLPYLSTDADRRIVPIEAYPVKGGPDRLYSGVVFGPWTFVKGRGGRTELYDRRVDPWQLSNLSHDSRYLTQKKRLRALSAKYADCAGQSCRTKFYR